MSSCCARPTNGKKSGTSQHCPECGRKGRAVDLLTPKALLHPEALARLEAVTYSFCPAPTCPVVYFANEAERVYHKVDLKVRVGLKEVDDPLSICYCFGHTRASVWEEIRRTGTSTIVASITAHVKAGRCACEVNNPSGTCCLGEVNKVVKEGLARFAAGVEEAMAVEVEDCCARSPTRSRAPATARS